MLISSAPCEADQSLCATLSRSQPLLPSENTFHLYFPSPYFSCWAVLAICAKMQAPTICETDVQVNIHPGHILKGGDPAAGKLVFENQQSGDDVAVQADLVVGADGASSTVRELLRLAVWPPAVIAYHWPCCGLPAFKLLQLHGGPTRRMTAHRVCTPVQAWSQPLHSTQRSTECAARGELEPPPSA